MALDVANSALVLVDLQRWLLDSAAPGSFLEASKDDFISNTRALVDAVHAARRPVFYIKVVRPAVVGLTNPANDPLAAGTAGADFLPELHPAADDIVVEKLRVSAFYATRLDGLLRLAGVRSLIVGGLYTHIGVESTVRDGWDRFYTVTIPKECCAAPTREAHENALALSFPRFATITTTRDVLNALAVRTASQGETR
jgi:nicotinamidase-related amidase